MDDDLPVQPVHLPQRLWSQADRDAAYLHYLSTGGRSLVETAKACGIPERTLKGWSASEHWPQRVVSDLADARAAVARQTIMRLSSKFPDLTESMVNLILNDTANPNARAQAYRTVAEMLGHIGRHGQDTRPEQSAPAPDARDVDQLRRLSPQELVARQRRRLYGE